MGKAAKDDAAKLMRIQRITANGSSWVINIPRQFLRPLGFYVGQYVQLTVLPDCSIHLKPIKEEIYDIRKVR